MIHPVKLGFKGVDFHIWNCTCWYCKIRWKMGTRKSTIMATTWHPYNLTMQLDADLRLSLPSNQFADVVAFLQQANTNEEQDDLAVGLSKLSKKEILNKTRRVAQLADLLKNIQNNKRNDLSSK